MIGLQIAAAHMTGGDPHGSNFLAAHIFATVYGGLVNMFGSPQMWTVLNLPDGFSATTATVLDWLCPCTWYVSINSYKVQVGLCVFTKHTRT